MTATLLPLGIKSIVFATPNSERRLMNALVTSPQGGQTFSRYGGIGGQVFEIPLIILEGNKIMIELQV